MNCCNFLKIYFLVSLYAYIYNKTLENEIIYNMFNNNNKYVYIYFTGTEFNSLFDHALIKRQDY